MWTLSFAICKSLNSQGSLRRICKKIIFKTNFLRFYSKTVSLKLKQKKKNPTYLDNTINYIADNNVKLAVSLIDEYSEPGSIRWNELTNKLKDLQVLNIRSAILRACMKTNNSEAGLSYFNYLIKNGEKLKLMDYTIFSKLFMNQKDILKNENIVINLYDNLKDHMLGSPLILDFVIKLVSEIPSCFFDLVERSQGKVTKGETEFMLIKALDHDRFDVVLKLLDHHDSTFNKNFIHAYLNFLTRMAAKHKFLPNFVTALTDICEKKASTLVCTDLYPCVTSFVKSVNQYQNDFIWLASNCQIGDKNVCSECGFKLLDKPMSDTDFKKLQKNFFLRIGLLNKNIFLSSSKKEFESFLTFLNTCKPYDVVIDFLNLFYQIKYLKVEKFNSVLLQLLNEGHRVLIIGKKHIEYDIFKKSVKMHLYKDKVQCFLADNMSDDDVFLLYAAIYNGPGKYILSGDYFTHYVPHLEQSDKNLFLRWKIYHQYLFVKGHLIQPCSHLNVPQLTTTPDQNGQMFVWHLSYKPDNSSTKINSTAQLNWVCLQAVKN